MNLVKSSLHHPQVTLLLTIAITLAGVYSLLTMPRREDPKITIRIGLIVAAYPGATAEQVEKQVTRKIEERLFRFAEVRKAKTWSTSRKNLCVINVELEDNVKQPDLFWSKLRHAMIELRLTQLPEGVQGPAVRDDFGDTTAMLLALHGGTYNYQQLKEYAQHVEDEFRTIRAVAKLSRIGEQSEQIQITSSMERVAQYALSPLSVIQALKGRNTVGYAGEFEAGTGRIPMKTPGLFQSEDEIRRLMIDMSSSGQPVYIGDLAEVRRVPAPPSTLCRYGGEPALMISVEMLEGNNIVQFGNQLRTTLEDVRQSLPPDLKIDILADQPAVVDTRITHFIREFGIAIGSVILVTVLLLPFRVALIASLAIPVTVAATFGMLNLLHVELHQVSIAVLIVVLGMVVDDAIVIADNYVELLDQKVPRDEAAWRCATELVVPVLTATATIIAAFLPMLIISGAVGEFIEALPVAVAVSLSCSFVVAMLLTPWLCRFFIRKGLHDHHREPVKKKFSVLDWMQARYNSAIAVAMRRKALTLASGVAVFVLSLILLVTVVPQRFFPTAERPQFVVHVWLPEGARLEATDEATRRIEKHLQAEPLVRSLAAFVGESAPRFYYNVDPEFPTRNYAQLLVNTTDQAATPPLVYRLRRELSRVAPEATVLVRELEQGTVMRAPVEVRIISTQDGPEDLVRLKAAGERVRRILAATRGAEYVYQDFREDSADLDIRVNEEAANRLGLSNTSIAMQMMGGFSGLPVSTFWEGDRDVPVVLRLDEQYRRNFEDVSDAYVVSTLTGARVPLRSVADVQPVWLPSRILHRNGVRTLTILAVSDENTLPSQVLAAARPALDGMTLAPGYRLEYGGESQGQRETFGEMKIVMAISVASIFLILLFQFRSVSQSLVVMMSIPLAIPGAVLGLALTGNPFSFTAFMGVISLSGVVVRNAIILVEYINERRRAGADIEIAALEAGERRLRPIFLTTAAAAVGVTPLILSGSSLWSPLASALAVGLIVSMFCTLIVVPVLYVVSERRIAGKLPAAALGTLLLLLASGPARAAEVRRITVDEAAALAVQQNSMVKLARLKVRESEARLDAMNANRLPMVTNESYVAYNGSLQSIVVPTGMLAPSTPIGPLPSSDLTLLQGSRTLGLVATTVAQPLTQLVKIREASRGARQDVRISSQDERRARNDIALKTREVYFGILILESRIEAGRQKSAAAEEARRQAKDSVETGAVLEVKSLEADARALEAANAVLTARTQADDLRTELNDLLGLPLSTRVELVPPAPVLAETPSLETLLTDALTGNPEVRTAEETVAKAIHGIGAARAEFIPEIGIFGAYAFQNGVPFLPGSNATVGAKMTWSVFDWGKRSAQLQERRIQKEMAEENLRRTRSRVAIDIEKARRKVDRIRDLVQLAERAYLVRQEARRIASDQVELGLASGLTLKQADAALAEAGSQQMEARLGMILAEAELARLTGR